LRIGIEGNGDQSKRLYNAIAKTAYLTVISHSSHRRLVSYLDSLCLRRRDYETAGNIREGEFFVAAMNVGSCHCRRNYHVLMDVCTRYDCCDCMHVKHVITSLNLITSAL
jgi:hypothetical protein